MDDFNKRIEEILDKGPHQRKCRISGKEFDVREEDIELYRKLKVPFPTLHPKLRRIRRLAFRNERHLFERKSDLSQQEMISMYPPDSPYKIFTQKEWWSDKWDPLDFGRDYNFGKNFFTQYNELQKRVPRPNLIGDPRNQNTEYGNFTKNEKNGYWVFYTMNSENMMYSSAYTSCKDCIDIFHSGGEELCYQNTMSEDCYNCDYLVNCNDCIDGFFLYDCKHCKDCFMSTNLRHKQYYWFNKQLSKKEYKEKLSKFNFGSYKNIQEAKSDFYKMINKALHKALNNTNCHNVKGNNLWRCENSSEIYNSAECYNVQYANEIGFCKDSLDLDYGATLSELNYEIVAGGFKNYMVKFSPLIRSSSNLEYCDHCFDCQDCFGCIGLRKKKYCIFNKQYEKEEYFSLVEKIKLKMLADGEYGEFFPFSLSQFPFSLTMGHEINSLSFNDYEEMVSKDKYSEEFKIFAWPVEEKRYDLEKCRKAEDIEDDIKDVSEDIIKKPIICLESKKPFKILKEELDFYKKKNIPVPRLHPDVRYAKLKELRPPNYLYSNRCTKCEKNIQTCYDKNKTDNIYCFECYKELVE